MVPTRNLLVAGTALVAAAPVLQAQGALAFQKPPRAILDVFDVENPPLPMVDAEARTLALLRRPAYLSLADLAQPELRLAGLRINPRTHNASRTRPYSGLTLQTLAGQPIPLKGLPQPLSLEYPSFSPTGAHFAFVEVQSQGLALWVVEIATGEARRLTEPLLSATLGHPYVWSPDGRSLYVRQRPDSKEYREAQSLPSGPAVQEAFGVKAPARTYQDLLRNPADEARFSFYATTAIQRVDLEGKATPFLPPALYRGIHPAPGGEYLLVSEVQRPFSYQFPLERFPSRVRVTDSTGATVATLAEKPLQDRIPVDFDACEAGRRHFAWREDRPATLTWAEALDGGDPSKAVPARDAVFQLEAPFRSEPQRLCATVYRYQGITWGDAHLAMVREGWWKTRRERTCRLDPSAPGAEPRVVFERSSEDAYGDPGDFVTTPNAFHRHVLRFNADHTRLFLEGEGCGPKGNRPFLDAFELATGRSHRLWQADGKSTYESILRVLDPEKGRLLTRIEGPHTYPNLHLRTFGKKGGLQAITRIETPFKALEGVRTETLRYRREDGVELNAKLFLPPGYDPARDGRLPMLLHAYPREFKDPTTAGQVKESPHRFVRPSWTSPVFWALRGYAILDDVAFPIVGKDKTEPNDTYLEQLVMNARAAIREAERLGVGDPKRVACVGHSYGAFMVANLLAHSDLFAAGIARSGAYNRTLTPFGFQSEERNYWQVPEVYHRMSPFDYADRIKTPLLMIHGDADSNPGTFTLQSERLFQAVKGLGGRARLVLLPMESHSYAARENLLHMLWEQDTWLEKYVKGAKR